MKSKKIFITFLALMLMIVWGSNPIGAATSTANGETVRNSSDDVNGINKLQANEIQPIVEYSFDNSTFIDLKGNSEHFLFSSENDGFNRNNNESIFGVDDIGSYWQWKSSLPRGGGFQVKIDREIKAEYAIGMKFSFDDVKGIWKKIIDYRNSTSDRGFYLYNDGLLQFYPHTASSYKVSDNEVVDLIAIRKVEDENAVFTVYLRNQQGELVKQLEIRDNNKDAIPVVTEDGKTILGFFFDDIITAREATSGGKIYQLTIWDKAISVEDILEKIDNGIVNVNYKDKQGNILKSEQIDGQVGSHYNSSALNFEGYQLSEMPANASGLITKNTQTVDFIYDRIYTITYTDGSNNNAYFEDQVFASIVEQEETPKFNGEPIRIGYSFDGWEPTIKETVTEDYVYTAKWNINRFMVKLETGEGTAVEPIMVEYNKTFPQPTNPFKENSIFKGWYTDESLTQIYDFTLPVTMDLVLYAKWDKVASDDKPLPPVESDKSTDSNKPIAQVNPTENHGQTPGETLPKTGIANTQLIGGLIVTCLGIVMIAFNKRKD
ncbi:InlB B-repeat-containing protein [Erysipelothrix aquatica]|uniref:InlB B-repeat-containing protein n=1 Tax=Erysipelothrix aquatica TaxID=2683714 RepID=UPI001357AF0E|nr:InlB B-repeat-containing protein [Erysipelothrix aquatica]